MDIITENEHDKTELLKDKSNNFTKSKSRSKGRKLQENKNNKSITEYFTNSNNH